MEKSKTKKIILSLVAVFALIICACASVITYAWFTDKESYTGTLQFGTIDLSVTGGVTGSSISFKFSRTGATKAMPGDTIEIPLVFTLKDGSEPAYYLVYITDTKNVFENAAFYLDGSNVYYHKGSKIYNQSTGAEVTPTNKVGTVVAGTNVSLTIKAKIAESTDNNQQGQNTTVTCKVIVIQQANLTQANAKTQLDAEAAK